MKPFVTLLLVCGLVVAVSGCGSASHGPLYYGNLSRLCDLGDKAACDAVKDLNAKYQRKIANKA